MLYTFVNQTTLIVLGLSDPFRNPSDFALEAFNEMTVLISGYH